MRMTIDELISDVRRGLEAHLEPVLGAPIVDCSSFSEEQIQRIIGEAVRDLRHKIVKSAAAKTK